MKLEWWAVIALVVVVVIAIFILIWLNRGNTLDIINQLPTYQIFCPKLNVYLGILNVPNPIFVYTGSSTPVPIGTTVWDPQVILSSNPDLNVWEIELPATSSFDVVSDTTIQGVKLINKIYQATSTGYQTCQPNTPCPGQTCNCSTPIPSSSGYVMALPPFETESFFQPTADSTNAQLFNYNKTGENKFTLTTEDGQNVTVDNFPIGDGSTIIHFLVMSPDVKVMEFQLVPIQLN